MKLIDSYNHVRTMLRPQVQGTCGLYSFYNAVCMLRHMNSLNPAVPAPKKCEALPGVTQSLRQYAKRELKSGQGEILSEAEMVTFVSAWGYKPATFVAGLYAAKRDFINLHTRAGHPVLIPYLADEDTTGIVPTITPASGDPGAHWSLIIGAAGTDAQVVEPNDPQSLRTWPMNDLLLANAITDKVKFARHYAKIVTDKVEYDRQLRAKTPATPRVDAVRSISPVRDVKNWSPSWDAKERMGEVKLYDLGGHKGSRQDLMKLSNVLVAIIAPHS